MITPTTTTPVNSLSSNSANEQVGECVSECANECVSECANECVNECANECVNECAGKRATRTVGFFLSSLQDMGGAVRVAVSLANRLCHEYRVVIIERTSHMSYAFELDERIEVVSLHSTAQRFRQQAVQVRKPLARALKEHNVCVLMGICVEESAMALLPCRATHTKLVFCDHGALINQLDDKTTTLLRRVCALACNKAVVLTHQSAHDYQRIFHTPAHKIEVIPNWVPDELLRTAPACAVQEKRMLWAGRLDHEKGVDHLFEIARRVMPAHPDWVWDVWGTAVQDETECFNLQGKLEQAGLSQHVRLRGCYTNTSDVFPNYSLATLTSYREGLPLFLLEAMAYGLPLLSFDVNTGPRDVIISGVNGFLVQPFDYDRYAACLGKLMSSEQLRKDFSASAKQEVQRFGEDAIYPAWSVLIRDLCNAQQSEAEQLEAAQVEKSEKQEERS